MNKMAYYRMPLTVDMARRPTEQELAADSKLSPYSRVPDGTLSGEVVVEVDLAAIAMTLGEKALRSAGKRAREIGGLVVVKATNIQRKGKTR